MQLGQKTYTQSSVLNRVCKSKTMFYDKDVYTNFTIINLKTFIGTTPYEMDRRLPHQK